MSSLFTNNIIFVLNIITFWVLVHSRKLFCLSFRFIISKIILNNVFFQTLSTSHNQKLVTFILKSEIIKTNRPFRVTIENFHKFLFFVIVVLCYNFHTSFNLGYKFGFKLNNSLLLLFHYMFIVLVKSIKKIKLI